MGIPLLAIPLGYEYLNARKTHYKPVPRPKARYTQLLVVNTGSVYTGLYHNLILN